MFDRHEVVFSNGAASESLYAGPEALNAIDSDATEELLTLFPELRHGVRPVPARPLASGRLGRKLVMRHQRNSKAADEGRQARSARLDAQRRDRRICAQQRRAQPWQDMGAQIGRVKARGRDQDLTALMQLRHPPDRRSRAS